MAPNRHFPARSMIGTKLVFTIVFVAVRRCLTRRQNLILGLAGPAFMRQWTRRQSAKLKITVFLCGVPKCIAMPVTRILGMCFQMAQSQPGFATVSIRRRLIFKETSNRFSDWQSLDLRWCGDMAGGGHKNPIKFRESHLTSAGHTAGVI